MDLHFAAIEYFLDAVGAPFATRREIQSRSLYHIIPFRPHMGAKLVVDMSNPSLGNNSLLTSEQMSTRDWMVDNQLDYRAVRLTGVFDKFA